MFQYIRLACLLAIAFPLMAAVGWEELASRLMDQNVVVQDQSRNTFRGKVRELNDASLILEQKNGERVPFRREDVRRIQKKSRAKGVLWGLGIGGGLGALAGGSLYRQFENEGSSGPEILAISLGLFTGAGAAIGLAAGKMETIYRGPEQERADAAPSIQESWRPYAFRENATAPAPPPNPKDNTEVPTYLTRAER